LADEGVEVQSVLLEAPGGHLGGVLGLVGEVGAAPGDAPITVSTGVVPLVELEVPTIAGVAPFAAPDLERGGRLSGEDVDGGGQVELRGYAEDLVRGAGQVLGPDLLTVFAGVALGEASESGVALRIRAHRFTAAEEMGVDEE